MTEDNSTFEEQPAAPSLKDIWNELKFEGKEQFQLNENNEIILLANEARTDKNLGTFNPNNWSAEYQKLEDNYQKLTEQAALLETQFAQAEDKLKLRPQIKTVEQQISNLPFLGDQHKLLNVVNNCQQQIDQIYNQNAEIRKALVEEANQLKESSEWHTTTEAFKTLIEKWKVAPDVRRSVNEQMWNAINLAKDEFFERKRKYYEELEKTQLVNLDLKLELCEKAEKLQHSEEWKATTEKMNGFLEEWKKIGPLPSAEKNDEMWERFNKARKTFFDRKHDHSDNIKIEQEKNYVEKLKLVEEAESLSNSVEWKKTTEILDDLQKKWDQLGRAPKEFNESLWERWRNSRNTFFDAKRANAKEFVATLTENYEKKKKLTERAEHLSKSENWKLATDELAQLMIEWKTIGPIPKEHGDDLWNRFNEARRLFFKRKDEDRERRRERFEQRAISKLSQTEQFLYTLRKEQKEDEEKLLEFSESIKDLKEENKKDLELKNHLTSLIQNLEKNIEKRKIKIQDVQSQLDNLQQK